MFELRSNVGDNRWMHVPYIDMFLETPGKNPGMRLLEGDGREPALREYADRARGMDATRGWNFHEPETWGGPSCTPAQTY